MKIQKRDLIIKICSTLQLLVKYSNLLSTIKHVPLASLSRYNYYHTIGNENFGSKSLEYVKLYHVVALHKLKKTCRCQFKSPKIGPTLIGKTSEKLRKPSMFGYAYLDARSNNIVNIFLTGKFLLFCRNVF